MRRVVITAKGEVQRVGIGMKFKGCKEAKSYRLR